MSVEEKKEDLLVSHLSSVEPIIDTGNEIVYIEDEKEETIETKQSKCIKDIQSIFDKGYTPENGGLLINYLQKQRSMLIEIMVNNFINRPCAKMADALNTTLAQMEKSVRDDRKETDRAKELQTSKETWDLFTKSLTAVMDGQLKVPTFGKIGLVLDPLKNEIDDFEDEIKDSELSQGIEKLDIKAIENVVLAQLAPPSGSEITK